jgi:hypothetical protein
MNAKDAFDLWWEWAEKPLGSMLMIPGRDTQRCHGNAARGAARPREGQ